MSSLFTRLLVDALNEYAYYAEIAGIQYEITINFYGLIVRDIVFTRGFVCGLLLYVYSFVYKRR